VSLMLGVCAFLSFSRFVSFSFVVHWLPFTRCCLPIAVVSGRNVRCCLDKTVIGVGSLEYFCKVGSVLMRPRKICVLA